MRDPGHAAGNQIYRPPPPPCRCGHPAEFHLLKDGRRRRCYSWHNGDCPCQGYELAPPERAAEQTAPGRGVQLRGQ